MWHHIIVTNDTIKQLSDILNKSNDNVINVEFTFVERYIEADKIDEKDDFIEIFRAANTYRKSLQYRNGENDTRQIKQFYDTTSEAHKRIKSRNTRMIRFFGHVNQINLDLLSFKNGENVSHIKEHSKLNFARPSGNHPEFFTCAKLNTKMSKSIPSGKYRKDLARTLANVIIKSGKKINLAGTYTGTFPFVELVNILVVEHKWTGSFFMIGETDTQSSQIIDLKNIQLLQPFAKSVSPVPSSVTPISTKTMSSMPSATTTPQVFNPSIPTQTTPPLPTLPVEPRLAPTIQPTNRSSSVTSQIAKTAQPFAPQISILPVSPTPSPSISTLPIVPPPSIPTQTTQLHHTYLFPLPTLPVESRRASTIQPTKLHPPTAKIQLYPALSIPSAKPRPAPTIQQNAKTPLMMPPAPPPSSPPPFQSITSSRFVLPISKFPVTPSTQAGTTQLLPSTITSQELTVWSSPVTSLEPEPQLYMAADTFLSYINSMHPIIPKTENSQLLNNSIPKHRQGKLLLLEDTPSSLVDNKLTASKDTGNQKKIETDDFAIEMLKNIKELDINPLNVLYFILTGDENMGFTDNEGTRFTQDMQYRVLLDIGYLRSKYPNQYPEICELFMYGEILRYKINDLKKSARTLASSETRTRDTTGKQLSITARTFSSKSNQYSDVLNTFFKEDIVTKAKSGFYYIYVLEQALTETIENTIFDMCIKFAAYSEFNDIKKFIEQVYRQIKPQHTDAYAKYMSDKNNEEAICAFHLIAMNATLRKIPGLLKLLNIKYDENRRAPLNNIVSRVINKYAPLNVQFRHLIKRLESIEKSSETTKATIAGLVFKM